MAEIAFVGGHGKVGLLALPLLSAAGFGVHAIVRKPEQRGAIEEAGAHPVIADIEHLDTPSIANVLRGRKAVVWCAGAGGGDTDRTYAVDRDAAIRTMDAAASAGATRFIMVSYFGAGPEHDTPPDSSFFAYAQAKSQADAHLARTSLAWTILRPSRLTDDPATGKIGVGTDQAKGSVSRGDVAATILAALSDRGSVGKIYEYNSGDTPIADALKQGGWHPPTPAAVGPTT